jgi:hypothetical protein
MIDRRAHRKVGLPRASCDPAPPLHVPGPSPASAGRARARAPPSPQTASHRSHTRSNTTPRGGSGSKTPLGRRERPAQGKPSSTEYAYRTESRVITKITSALAEFKGPRGGDCADGGRVPDCFGHYLGGSVIIAPGEGRAGP